MLPVHDEGATGGARLHCDTAAEFEQLFHRSYTRAYNAAYRLMGNASDAEDLTQEAFVRVWAAFDRYDRTRPFEGWLFRILSNLAIDRWRRSAGLTVCSLDAATSGGGSAMHRTHPACSGTGGAVEIPSKIWVPKRGEKATLKLQNQCAVASP